MKIKRIQDGFVQWEDNAYIERVECSYIEKTCTIYFRNGTSKVLSIGCSGFNSQYGVPVSKDGTQLFFSDWKAGLHAYDISSGDKIWTCRTAHITRVFVCSQHLTVLRQGYALMRISIQTGEILQTFKNRDMELAYEIDKETFLVKYISGALCAVNKENLSIYKCYDGSATNPHSCLSLVIQDIQLCDNKLRIIGVEKYPNGSLDLSTSQKFERVIDPCYREQSMREKGLKARLFRLWHSITKK